MSLGGKRPGAGRPRGAKTKRKQEVAEAAAEAGVTPIEYMLGVMRDSRADRGRRDAMAVAAAPYCHPRKAPERAPVEAEARSGDGTITLRMSIPGAD